MINLSDSRGSIELIVIGLLAALIIVLVIPLIRDIGSQTRDNLSELSSEFGTGG